MKLKKIIMRHNINKKGTLYFKVSLLHKLHVLYYYLHLHLFI